MAAVVSRRIQSSRDKIGKGLWLYLSEQKISKERFSNKSRLVPDDGLRLGDFIGSSQLKVRKRVKSGTNELQVQSHFLEKTNSESNTPEYDSWKKNTTFHLKTYGKLDDLVTSSFVLSILDISYLTTLHLYHISWA